MSGKNLLRKNSLGSRNIPLSHLLVIGTDSSPLLEAFRKTGTDLFSIIDK
jgi:hypothetical protein